jgi:mannose-6-phosphate isomerase-like protein (cupin superfamily)
MAKLFRDADARPLSLPGRIAREVVSGTSGAKKVSLRLVEIAPPRPGEKPRGPHVHYTFEEVIHVLSGEGVAETPGGRLSLKAGDTLLVPAGERHVTHNTGTEPLRLICFFPVGDVASGTEEFSDWEAPKAAS